MARPPPDDDPRVTDLRRYRKAREQAKRKPAPKPPADRLLGPNRWAGPIMVVIMLLFAALWLGPLLAPLVMKLL
jgi:hypothetical protein